ncbi:MAG: hypothetical protein ACR2KW_10125 [Rubrobacter sp.]
MDLFEHPLDCYGENKFVIAEEAFLVSHKGSEVVFMDFIEMLPSILDLDDKEICEYLGRGWTRI